MEITIKNAKVFLDTRTTEKWGEVTKAIPKGFPCVELADDDTIKFKVGDGIHTYEELPYIGADVDLSDYPNNDDMEQAISDAVSELGDLFSIKGRVDIVGDLDEKKGTAEKGDVYLVGKEQADSFEEYYWTGEKWEFMGSTGTVDLTDYYKKNEVDTLLADKIGKGDVLIINCSLPEE